MVLSLLRISHIKHSNAVPTLTTLNKFKTCVSMQFTYCHQNTVVQLNRAVNYGIQHNNTKATRAYRGLTGGFLLLRNFSVATSVSPHVYFILVLIF